MLLGSAGFALTDSTHDGIARTANSPGV
jgi:hypothetical protein